MKTVKVPACPIELLEWLMYSEGRFVSSHLVSMVMGEEWVSRVPQNGIDEAMKVHQTARVIRYLIDEVRAGG